MTIQEAQEFQQVLAKHNPFVRIVPELAAKAELANKILQRNYQPEIVEEALF